MTTPFSFAGTLNYPPDAGQPNVAISMAMSGQFASVEPGQVLRLTGSGTKVVDLGTSDPAGLKGLLIKVDAGGTAINLRYNGGGSSGQMEISPGGFVAIGSPAPSAGITAITIVYTADVTVRLWAFG